MMLSAWMAMAAVKLAGGSDSFYERMKHKFYAAITAHDSRSTNAEIREQVVS